MDIVTLCDHICVSQNTVDNWVAAGILPPPRKRGGKLMWRWREVDERLALGQSASEPETRKDEVNVGREWKSRFRK